MVIIQKGSTFLKDGAIVPNEKELGVILHALIEEYDRVVRSHGDRYGQMSIGELSVLIGQFQRYQKERGET